MLHFLMLFGLTALCGGLAIAPKVQAQEKQNNNIVERQPAPKRVSYNDVDFEITLSGIELTYQFEHLFEYSQDITFTYQSNEYHFYQDKTTYGYIQYEDSSEHAFNFVYDGVKFTNYLENGDTYLDYTFNTSGDALTSNLLITTSSSDYAVVKSAIELDIQANSQNDMPAVLSDFITILISGINSLASGIAGGIVTMAKALFLDVNATTGAVTGLSVFGGIVAIFAGLALAIAITTKVYLWVTSLGN